jgi:hypothetical protein
MGFPKNRTKIGGSFLKSEKIIDTQKKTGSFNGAGFLYPV